MTFLHDHFGILIVSCVFLVAATLSLNQVLVYTPDSARYLAWAKSLAHFEGFRDLTAPGPAKYVVHAPLYSVLLAPVAAIFPYSVPAAKMLTALLGIAALVAFERWIRESLGKTWGIVGSILLAVNPAFVLYSTQVLSDVPFAFAVVVIFICADRAVEAPERGWTLNPWFVAAAICSIFLREVGIAIVAAAVIYLLLVKRPRLAIQLVTMSILFYLLWYVRNEVIVASSEHPPMRNTQLFLGHVFTPASASLVDEFSARLTSNGIVYGLALIRMPLMADIVLRNISSYSPAQFPVSFVLNLLPFLYKPFVLITCAAIVGGMVSEFRRHRRFSFLILVLTCYSVPILLYPINDTRFLVPILLVLVYFMIAGLKWIVDFLSSLRLPSILLKVGGSLCLFVLLIPNIGWTVTYVSNNFRDGQAPLRFFERVSTLPSYPELFARPLNLAGEWIAQRTDPAGVVMCRWKELAVWTSGRRVLDTDPQATPDEFDRLLRDYRIHFIVTVHSRGGLREYETQFARSREFSFATVQRIADIEIVEVLPYSAGASPSGESEDTSSYPGRLRFAEALRMIQDDRPKEAETILTHLPDQFRYQVPVQMNVAIAKELEGQLDSAGAILFRFRFIQQAGSAVQQAWNHLQIIAAIREASGMPRGTGKSEMFYRAALDYWNLGYRKSSLRFLDSAIAVDNSYFPALAFKAVCATLEGDTSSARRALGDAQRLDPTNVLVMGLGTILDIKSRISREADPRVRNTLRYNLASELSGIGLREESIDEVLSILRWSPNDARALRFLVDAYTAKERYEPARFYLKRLVSLEPDDVKLGEKLRDLENRW